MKHFRVDSTPYSQSDIITFLGIVEGRSSYSESIVLGVVQAEDTPAEAEASRVTQRHVEMPHDSSSCLRTRSVRPRSVDDFGKGVRNVSEHHLDGGLGDMGGGVEEEMSLSCNLHEIRKAHIR